MTTSSLNPTLFLARITLFIERLNTRDDRGASLVEYALLLALIAMVCFGAVQFLGESLPESLSKTGNSISN